MSQVKITRVVKNPAVSGSFSVARARMAVRAIASDEAAIPVSHARRQTKKKSSTVASQPGTPCRKK